jgi:outer membrane protein OmpA-like peptidoglycan-associated protein
MLAVGCGGGAKHKSARGGSGTAHTPSLRGIKTFTYVQDQGFYPPSESRVTIYDLRRWGAYVTLDFAATCLTSSGCTGAFFNTNSGNYGGAPEETPRDISLVDTTNDLEYLPVTDRKGHEFASEDPPTAGTSPPILMWVTFPAPPPKVTSLDVLFPGGGPEVPDVPITAAAAGPKPAQVGDGAIASPANPFSEPSDSTTTGLHLVVDKLQLAAGNPAGGDAETPGHTTLTLGAGVLFTFGQSNLTGAARKVLSGVAARIKANATGVVSVNGYTDSSGNDAVNIPLSQARARSVVDFLKPATAGTKVTYTSQGFGSADPVAPNSLPNGADNPAGRRLNRRVTISYNVTARVKPSAPVAGPAASSPAGGSASRSVTFTVKSAGTSTYRANVNSLFRDGNMLVLRFSVKCLAQTGPSVGCDGILNLGGDTSTPPFPAYKGQAGTTYRSVGGIYLQDSGGTDYIPVYTQTAKSIVAVETNQLIGATPFPLWAYYPAPPRSVTSMTVVFPTGVKLAGIPIADTAPPLP